jgi:uncharacterized phage infection (PIP) family protein YhgE
MLKDGMEKMLMAKKGKQGEMSKEDVQAKMDVLHELLQMAHDAMGGKVKHGMDEMQKVSVMAPDQKGIKEGLAKAAGMMEESPEESPEMEMDLEGEMSPEEKAKSLLEESPEEEAKESPEQEASEPMEQEEESLFSKKPKIKEEPKKKKLFSMMD